MRRLAECYMQAARVPATVHETPLDEPVGRWSITRLPLRDDENSRRSRRLGWENYTALHTATWATVHRRVGEIVMEDTAEELSRHLPIWMHGYGRVLVTGLGLGCVVRGLLASVMVDHIDVVEIDPDIVRLIGPEFAEEPRVTIHSGDAFTIEWPASTRWDCAWHDIWSDEDAGQPHLQVLHGRLIVLYHDRVRHQGAWQLPRIAKRNIRLPLLGGPRRAWAA